MQELGFGDLLAIRGRFGRVRRLGVVVPVWGEPVVYTCARSGLAACCRSGRLEPVGVHANLPADWTGAEHYPLRRPLYDHEIERANVAAEVCLGSDYPAFAMRGGLLRWLACRFLANEKRANWYAADLVSHVWAQIGLPVLRGANPTRLVRQAVRRGIVQRAS